MRWCKEDVGWLKTAEDEKRVRHHQGRRAG
jgi:hypothetical protein